MWKLVGLGALCVAALFLAAGFIAERLCELRDVRRFPAPGRLVDVGGHKLHLYCEGEAAGPVIVVEQGAGSPSLFWRPIQHAIAQGARICTYDRPGVLWSPPVDGARSITERAADLHALLAAAGIAGPYILVGHSLGGLIITRFLREHASEVAGVVFVDAPDEPAIYESAYPAQLKRMVVMLRGFGIASRFALLRLVNPLFSESVPGLSRDEQGALRSLTAWPRFWRAFAGDMASVVAATPDERVPLEPGSLGARPVVAVTHGIRFPPPYDAIEKGWGEGQQRLCALSSNSALVTAEKSSHNVPVEEPQVVIDAIRRAYRAAVYGGAV